jgi:hypothetical protein
VLHDLIELTELQMRIDTSAQNLEAINAKAPATRKLALARYHEAIEILRAMTGKPSTATFHLPWRHRQSLPT